MSSSCNVVASAVTTKTQDVGVSDDFLSSNERYSEVKSLLTPPQQTVTPKHNLANQIPLETSARWQNAYKYAEHHV